MKTKLLRDRKKRNSGLKFKTYICKVLKIVDARESSHRIGRNALAILDDMCKSILQRVEEESGEMMKNSKTVTFTENDVISIFQLIFPGDLGKHAVSEAYKAIAAFESSSDDSKEEKEEEEEK